LLPLLSLFAVFDVGRGWPNRQNVQSSVRDHYLMHVVTGALCPHAMLTISVGLVNSRVQNLSIFIFFTDKTRN